MLISYLKRIRRGWGLFWPCCCTETCCETFHVICGFSTPVVGATVTLKSGGTTVASGVTDASGNVVLCVPAGDYTVTITGSSCTSTFARPITVACGGTYNLQCCFCDVTICIQNCDGSGTGYYTCGATMTIVRDGIEIASCHTSTGCCTFTGIGAGATATITADDTSFAPTVVETTCSTPDDPMLVGLTSASGFFSCCAPDGNPVGIPRNMMLSDNAGSIAFDFCDDGLTFSGWVGCRIFDSPNTFGCDDLCDCTPLGTYGILVIYTGTCNDDGTFTVQRGWAWLDSCQAQTGPGFIAQTSGSPCGSALTCADSPHTGTCLPFPSFCEPTTLDEDGSTGTAALTSCETFSLSVPMSGAAGPLGDPVGGDCVLS